ncbi:MAG: DUF427 domain-containing protein [Chloroflexota bacterium]
MKAIWNGITIAESDNTVVVEGNHYFPKESVNAEFLKDSSHTTVCPWKGTASYYTLTDGNGKESANAAWYYPAPKNAAAEIKDHVAFYSVVQVTA